MPFGTPGGKIVVYEGLLPGSFQRYFVAIVLGGSQHACWLSTSAEQLSKAQNQQVGTRDPSRCAESGCR